MKPIINLGDVQFQTLSHGDKFEAKDGGISRRGRLGPNLDYWDGE